MSNKEKPDWSVHPHNCYSIGLRIFLATLGSTLPIGCALIGNGILKNLDDGVQKVGLVFVVVCVVALAAWIIGIIKTVRAELKDLSDYAVLGSVYPANTFLIFFLVQAIK